MRAWLDVAEMVYMRAGLTALGVPIRRQLSLLVNSSMRMPGGNETAEQSVMLSSALLSSV